MLQRSFRPAGDEPRPIKPEARQTKGLAIYALEHAQVRTEVHARWSSPRATVASNAHKLWPAQAERILPDDVNAPRYISGEEDGSSLKLSFATEDGVGNHVVVAEPCYEVSLGQARRKPIWRATECKALARSSLAKDGEQKCECESGSIQA